MLDFKKIKFDKHFIFDIKMGSLSVGKYADFVVFDNNFVENESLVLETKVEMTFIDGKMVYSKK